MKNYQEKKLKKFRNIVCFSFLFVSFFCGEFWFTGHLFGWHKIRQQKIKIRQQYLNEFNYQLEWYKRYEWRTI